MDYKFPVGVGVRCGHVDEGVAKSARVPRENIRVEEERACVFQLQRRLQIPRWDSSMSVSVQPKPRKFTIVFCTK